MRYRALLWLVLATTSHFLAGQNCVDGSLVANDIIEKTQRYQQDINCKLFGQPACRSLMISRYKDQMSTYWNRKTGSGWSHLNLKKLTASGTIIELRGGQDQLFITPHPSFKNQVRITVRERSGSSLTNIQVCTHSPNNISNPRKQEWFNVDEAARNNNSETRTITINNAKGKIISVYIENRHKALVGIPKQRCDVRIQ